VTDTAIKGLRVAESIRKVADDAVNYRSLACSSTVPARG